MEAPQRVLLTKLVMLVGGLLCLGWLVVSLRALIDSATETETVSRVCNALGPLGVILVLLGIVIDPRRRRED
jgi:hypothetical protein